MDNILYALLFQRILFTQPYGNQVQLKITRLLRQQYNTSYTIPFSNNQTPQTNNSRFKDVIKFYFTYHDIDETASCTLTDSLLNFIQRAIIPDQAHNTQCHIVFFEIEDINPNASRILDVDVVIGELEMMQTLATQDDDRDCFICPDNLRGPNNINTLINNSRRIIYIFFF